MERGGLKSRKRAALAVVVTKTASPVMYVKADSPFLLYDTVTPSFDWLMNLTLELKRMGPLMKERKALGRRSVPPVISSYLKKQTNTKTRMSA